MNVLSGFSSNLQSLKLYISLSIHILFIALSGRYTTFVKKVFVKTMKRIVYGLMIIVLVSSCKKTEETSLIVTVYDQNLKKGVPNKTVYLEENTTSSNPGFVYGLPGMIRSENYKVIWEGISDANGKVNFGYFNSYKGNKYDYYVELKDGYRIKIGTGGSQHASLYVETYDSLKIKFVAPPPYSGTDSMRLEFYYINQWYPHPAVIIRSADYTEFNGFTWPGTYYYNVDKYKSGVYTNRKDTVFYDVNSSYEYDAPW